MKTGDYLRQKRIERNITLREIARRMGITATFLSDMERVYRKIPQKQLKQFVRVLNLNHDESITLYDLYAAEQQETPLDVAEYLLKHRYAVDCIRAVIKQKGTKEDWLKFTRYIIGGTN